MGERKSHCKVNLLLNILGKRDDGYHELETLMHPVWLFDTISFERAGSGISLTCSDPSLPVDSGNLVYKAAELFLSTAGIRDGVRLFLQKNLPLAAGMGGGSGNAACTLLGMDELFGGVFPRQTLMRLAAQIGSDVPFFIQDGPALAFGRGEVIEPAPSFTALDKAAFVIVHPGFGVSTPWAYKQFAQFPEALHGHPGRARALSAALASGSIHQAAPLFYNAFEAPVFNKYPLLELHRDFFREHGAVSLMSGSGSSTFAIAGSVAAAELLLQQFREKFGNRNWAAVCPCARV